jgi:glutathione-regulated potassium-efflux system protein KefB
MACMLSQGGEFGFVVFGAARALGVIDDLTFAMAIAVISLTMLLTPVLFKLGHWLALRAATETTAVDQHSDYASANDEGAARVVIAGYGRGGHTVGTILASSAIPYVAFDSDAILFGRWRGEGHPVCYGDVGNPDLLGNVLVRNGPEAEAGARAQRTAGLTAPAFAA